MQSSAGDDSSWPGNVSQCRWRNWCGAIVDFSKTLNKVPHERFHHELDFYGIHGTTIAWIKDFLMGCDQTAPPTRAHTSWSPKENSIRFLNISSVHQHHHYTRRFGQLPWMGDKFVDVPPSWKMLEIVPRVTNMRKPTLKENTPSMAMYWNKQTLSSTWVSTWQKHFPLIHQTALPVDNIHTLI